MVGHVITFSFVLLNMSDISNNLLFILLFIVVINIIHYFGLLFPIIQNVGKKVILLLFGSFEAFYRHQIWSRIRKTRPHPITTGEDLVTHYLYTLYIIIIFI